MSRIGFDPSIDHELKPHGFRHGDRNSLATSGALDYIRSLCIHQSSSGTCATTPVNGGHAGESAIWQDDGTIVETAQCGFNAFLNKFKTQLFKTDDLGKPI